MEELLLTVHLLAAGTWIGANVVQLLVFSRLAGAGPAVAAHWYRTAVSLGTRLYTPAAVLLLLTGFGLIGTSDDLYSMGDPFVSLGFLTVIVGAVLSMRFFAPLGRKAAEAHESGGDPTPYEKRIALLGTLDTVLVVVTFAAMVGKWGV